MIPVGSIVPSPFQPRAFMDEEALRQLSESIRRSGVMQPVLVRVVRGGGVTGRRPVAVGGAAVPAAPSREGEGEGGERYELVAGERRWRAAALVGLKEVPALVRELSDVESAELALVENVQREDLNPVERARALRRLSERFGLTHEDVAGRVGLNRSTVTNLIRLTELEEEILELIGNGELTMGHGRALLTELPGPYRVRLARSAAKRGWSVRRMEKEVTTGAVSEESEPSEAELSREAQVADLERRLAEHLGTRVRITTQRNGTRGRIVVEFYDLDHFDGLMGRMGFGRG